MKSKKVPVRKRESAVTLTQMKSVMGGMLTEFKNEIKDEITSIKDEIVGMKGDIAGIKDEIVGMKGDIAGIKDEIVGMKGDISDIKNEQVKMNEKLFNLYALMQQDFVKQVEFEKLELRVETLEVP